MAKKTLALTTELKPAVAANFSDGTLNAAERAANAIRLNVGSIYVVIPQKFHGESTSTGNVTNVAYAVEINKAGVNLAVLPYSAVTNMFIAKEGEEKEVPVIQRERDGEVFLRPACAYHPATKGGNMTFRRNGSDIEVPETFALKCTDYITTVSATYAPKQDGQQNAMLITEKNSEGKEIASLQYRMTYLFERVNDADMKKVAAIAPINKEELEAALRELGKDNEWNTIQAYLL